MLIESLAMPWAFLILLIAVTLWSYSPSRWHRRLGWLAIALVSLGTGLGMYQVRHAPSKSAAALLNGGFALASAGMLLGIAVTLIEGRSRFAGRWHRILALAAFLAVIVQGLLGGLRVYLNELSGPELAIIHGVFAQFVAAAVCSLALVSSVRWNRFTELRTDSWIRLASLVLLLLLLIQIVFGGMLRHLDATWGKRLHPMLAILVLVIGAGLVWRATQTGLEHPILSRKARSLFGMMVIQALLELRPLYASRMPQRRTVGRHTGMPLGNRSTCGSVTGSLRLRSCSRCVPGKDVCCNTFPEDSHRSSLS
jgi:heme A synthase